MTNKCSYCKNIAIYYRRNSGEYLCRKHFIESIERKVRRAIGDKLKGRKIVGLAVSGGKDSSTMAYIMWKLSQRHRQTKLIGLIIDEGIKGYRDKSIEYAVNLMEELGIEYHIGSFKDEFGFTVDELIERGVRNPCTYCGVFRRRMMEIMGRKYRVDILLTGHNANDIAETVLLNIIQGHIKHIIYDLEVGESLIPHLNPLKYVLEGEVVLYAYVRGIKYYEESCPYIRYALRREVRTFLNNMEWRHPGITFNILRISEKLKEKKLPVNPCEKCGYPTTRKICKVCELLNNIMEIKAT